MPEQKKKPIEEMSMNELVADMQRHRKIIERELARRAAVRANIKRKAESERQSDVGELKNA